MANNICRFCIIWVFAAATLHNRWYHWFLLWTQPFCDGNDKWTCTYSAFHTLFKHSKHFLPASLIPSHSHKPFFPCLSAFKIKFTQSSSDGWIVAECRILPMVTSAFRLQDVKVGVSSHLVDHPLHLLSYRGLKTSSGFCTRTITAFVGMKRMFLKS